MMHKVTRSFETNSHYFRIVIPKLMAANMLDFVKKHSNHKKV